MGINANSGEYKSRVGLKDVYIAEVLQDDIEAYLAGTPEYFAPSVEASQATAVNRETQYADDQAFETMSSEGETTINLTVTGIPIEMLAKITGRVFDAASGRLFDNVGTPPYFAMMFRSLKSNGKYRYYSFLKGRFDMPSEDYATQTATPEAKTIQITFTAVKTAHAFALGGSLSDSVKRVMGDEDTTNFSAAGWFSQVQTPVSGSVPALALSSSTPADDATGVSVSANLTLTFNNALVNSAVNHVTLLDETNSPVACTKTLSVTKKLITIDPTASLSSGDGYALVLAGITDIYGQVLADTVITFTTA